MKVCGKILLIMFWLSMVLILGWYLVFRNLGFLLTAEHTGFNCRLLPEWSGVRLQAGDSVEVIKFKFPLQIRGNGMEWAFKTSRGVVSFSFKPLLRIRWKKPVVGRSSSKDGE